MQSDKQYYAGFENQAVRYQALFVKFGRIHVALSKSFCAVRMALLQKAHAICVEKVGGEWALGHNWV